MRKLVNKKYVLVIILFLAAFLRLWKLASIPPHLTPDEAALGYNAYSILKTGRDEYGEFLPVIFKSFGDFKPGLYVYLTAPLVAIFGLNEFSVRLPSALLGVLAVLLIYAVVGELFNRGTERNFTQKNAEKLALLSAALLAISPWHIHFSRGAWEVNVALTLTLAGIYFFLKSLTHNSKFIIHASLFFASTLITYQGAKLSTLIVVLILAVVYRKELYRLVRVTPARLAIAGVVGVVIASPILLSLFQGKTGRLEVFSVFSYPRPEQYLQDFLDQGSEKVGSLTYYLFHSESFNFSRGVMGRWFNHFSGRFLFFEGDWQNPRHTVPNHGVGLLTDLLLLPLGLFALFKYSSRAKLFIILWMLLAPLPSILTRDQVHAVRAYNLVIPFTIISSLGLIRLYGLYKSLDRHTNRLLEWTKFKPKFFSSIFVLFFFVMGLIYYLDSYFIHLSKHDSKLWEYGYKQIVETVTPIQNNFDEVKIQQSFAQPYIYFLFFQQYDPSKYQKQARLTESEFVGDVGYVEKLDNICFCAIDWSVNRGESGKLFVADTIRIPPEDSGNPEQFNLIKEINYLDGNPAFRIIEVL